MVYGVLQLINFAHSEVFMYGTFAVVWTLYFMGGTPQSSTGAIIGMLLVALVVAMLTSAVVALLLERFAYRPLLARGAPKLVTLISAIGASFVLAEIMGLRGKITAAIGLDDNLERYVRRSRDTTGFPVDIQPEALFTIGDYPVTTIDALVIGSALLMMVALDQFVGRSRLGRGIRAVAQDPESAALMGVNSVRVVQLTFFLGGLMAGAAATLYMIRIGVTRFDAGFILGVKAFTAAVMGGIGNLRGALVGGLVLGVAENYGSAIIGTEWKDVVAFILLVVILLFRPTGILGESLGKARA
jgi:branched-chain amino acid transport system permease protein